MEVMFTRIGKAQARFRDWQHWMQASRTAPEPDELGRGAARGVARGRTAEPTILPLVMQVAVSLAVLAAGFYIILSGAYETETQKWAFGVVGIVVGFWLS